MDVLMKNKFLFIALSPFLYTTVFAFFFSIIAIQPMVFANTKNETVILRNGALANSERVEKVWQSLNDLYQEKWHMQYFWLWRTAKKCRELGNDNCKLDTLFQNAEETLFETT